MPRGRFWIIDNKKLLLDTRFKPQSEIPSRSFLNKLIKIQLISTSWKYSTWMFGISIIVRGFATPLFWLNLSSCHIYLRSILLNDIVDLNLLRTSSLAPAAHCCVFCNKTSNWLKVLHRWHGFASTLISYHTEKKHTGHRANRLTQTLPMHTAVTPYCTESIAYRKKSLLGRDHVS